MTKRPITAQMAGVGLGVALAAMLLASGVVRGGGATLAPTSVTLVAQRSDDLDVQPVTKPLGHALLWPASRGLERTITARNATGHALVVRLRARPPQVILDDVLAVRVRADGKTVFQGMLAGLRAEGTSPYTLASHVTSHLVVRTWIPAGNTSDVRIGETIPLEFVTAAAKS